MIRGNAVRCATQCHDDIGIGTMTDMQGGFLTFIIPIRHQLSVGDWSEVEKNLALTLQSIAAQTSDHWCCIVVANTGAKLPPLPRQTIEVRVDLPLPTMPDRTLDEEAFYNAVRDDKGARILAGLRAMQPRGHVMVVDYDDLVSSKLAAFVALAADAPGWYFDTGLLFSGTLLSYRQPREFHRFCGTSHMIRHDLLIPDVAEATHEEIRYRLGSHRYIEHFLEQEGHPLSRLPFVGAAYRIGHSGANSGSKSLLNHVFEGRQVIKHPIRSAMKATRLRLRKGILA